MKSFLFLILTMVFLASCGTTGHIQFYNFNASKYEVEKQFLQIINKDSVFSVPPKWYESTTGDALERYYVYFSASPEEMYQVGFTGDSTEWKKSHSSKLGLIGTYDGDRFRFESDLPSKEQVRIKKRFEEEILSKMMLYYKSE